MTALRTIVGVCNKYVKALKKRLTGKGRDERRPQWRRRYPVAPELSDGAGNCYDNEAADNVINEFIANRMTKAVGGKTDDVGRVSRARHAICA